MLENVEQMLLLEYGIKALSLEAVPAGWSASAWKVHTGSGDYFLKVYDKNKPSTKGWVERIDAYMPAVLWLNENTRLRGKMIAPILAKDGAYKKEDADYLYMVFPFIYGQTIGGGRLSPGQAREIAQIVAALHQYDTGIPVNTTSLRETFDVSFCTDLAGWLENTNHVEPMDDVFTEHKKELIYAIAALEGEAASLRNAPIRYALCHTDIHGWNLMQGESLFLIDWEGLRLAPVEADLFSFTDTFFFADAWQDFMAVYQAAHQDYRVNEDAMRFFRLRRRLEDIHAFAQSLLMDNLSREEKDKALHYLKQECGLLHVMQ